MGDGGSTGQIEDVVVDVELVRREIKVAFDQLSSGAS
jgi:hypothetical protein